MHNDNEHAKAWSQIFSVETKKQCIPVVTAWQQNERMYGELQGLNTQETADRYGKEQVHEWHRSYDTPPPNGESLEMCAQRAIAYFKEQKNLAGKDWNVSYRAASVLIGGLKLGSVGVISSIGVVVASHILYAMRKIPNPTIVNS